MVEKIEIEKMEWTAPEYSHQERSADWYWTVGLIFLIAIGASVWFKNYVFAIFLFISGVSVFLFAFRHPPKVYYSVDTNGFTMGKDKHDWANIKGFDIKKDERGTRLLVELKKYFLPVYTIPIPDEMADQLKEELEKVSEEKELYESQSLLITEKLGF